MISSKVSWHSAALLTQLDDEDTHEAPVEADSNHLYIGRTTRMSTVPLTIRPNDLPMAPFCVKL